MNWEQLVETLSRIPNDDGSPIRLWPVEQGEITQAEQKLDRDFPTALKDVWRDIGSGSFRHALSGGPPAPRANILLAPQGIIDAKEEVFEKHDGLPFSIYQTATTSTLIQMARLSTRRSLK